MAEKLLSEQFRKEIEDSPFTDDNVADLYEAVKGMSDDEFKEYIYTNRTYFKQNMPAVVDGISSFQKFVSEEPNWGVKKGLDYEKITGSSDALDKFDEYDMKDMEYFGSKVGMTGKEFLNQMAKDKINQDRRRIAHGEDEGGWFDSPKSFAKNAGGAFMNVMAPRTQEAIERGEDPSAKDYLLDQGSNLLETLPVGKISRGKKLMELVANGLVPLTEEVADAIAYGDENPRGNFSVADVVKGTGVNFATPKLLNRWGVDINQVGSKTGIPWSKLQLLGQGNLTDIFTNKLGSQIYANRQANMPGLNLILRPLSEYEKEKDEEKLRKKNKESATKKYLIRGK